MKQALITALKAKFGELGDDVLSWVAGRLIAKGEVKSAEDIPAVVESMTLQQVVKSWGDARADGSQKSAVENYEKKHKLKDGKPVEEGNDQKSGSGSAAGAGAAAETGGESKGLEAMMQQILEGQKSLNERLDNLDREKTANSRQAQLAEILKNAPQSVRSRYEKDFARMTFKDDDEFAGWLTELTPDIEQMSADMGAKGASVSRPKGGAHGGQKTDEPNPYLKARVEAREKAATPTPAIQGLATNP